jgi:Tfp pilus assembly protein FimT
MSFKRVIILVLAALILASMARPAYASDRARVMASVHQFIDGLNTGNKKSAVAACATPASVLDDFAPHEWQGPTACADWLKAYDAYCNQNGITGGVVTLGTPWHVNITGDRAYVVVPANYTFKQNGKPAAENGSIFTVALKKLTGGWRITGWAWADH